MVLIAGRRRSIMGDYRQPRWATAFGLLALAATVVMAGFTIYQMLSSFLARVPLDSHS